MCSAKLSGRNIFWQRSVCRSKKQIIKFLFEPKNERNYFCISALAFKSGQIKKM